MKALKWNKVWFRAIAACLCMVLVIGLVPVQAMAFDGTAAETEGKDALGTAVPAKPLPDFVDENGGLPDMDASALPSESEMNALDGAPAPQEPTVSDGAGTDADDGSDTDTDYADGKENGETSEGDSIIGDEPVDELSGEEDKAAMELPAAASLSDVEVSFKVAVTSNNKQPSDSAFKASEVNVSGGQYAWLYLKVTNNGTEDIELTYHMDVQWGDSSYSSGQMALSKPKTDGSGERSNYEWTVESVSGGEFISSGNHNVDSAIRLPASGSVILRTTKVMEIDGTLATGQKAVDTITLAYGSDTISASVTINKPYPFHVEQGHTHDTNTNKTHNTESGSELEINEGSAKFWIKIENVTDLVQTFVLNDTFAVNGAGDHDLYESIERLVDRKDFPDNSSDVRSVTVRKDNSYRNDVEVTLGPRGYIWFATNGSYTPPVGSYGDVITNTITIWVKGEENAKQAYTLTLNVPGTPMFDVVQEFGVIGPDNVTVNWEASSTINEDDWVTFKMTVRNLGPAGTAFTIGDTFYIDTVSGRGGTESPSDAPNFALNTEESIGVTPDGDGYRFDSEDSVAVFYAQDIYVPGEGYYEAHSAKPQVKNTVTVFEVGGDHAATSSVVLNIAEPSAKFTVETAFSVNNGGWRTSNTSLSTAQVETAGGTSADKSIEAMARITNNGRTDIVIDLNKIGITFIKTYDGKTNKSANEPVFSFDASIPVVNESRSTGGYMISDDGKVTIPYGCTVQIQWEVPYVIDGTERGRWNDGDRLTLQVTAYDEQSRFSADDDVSITIDNSSEQHLGYSMSVFGADFKAEELEYKGPGLFQRKNGDGKYEKMETDFWETRDHIQIYYNGTTESAGAKKYMHVVPSSTGDDVLITSLEPVSDEYTFLCWYDKNARVGNELVLPGDHVNKDSETEHTIDAVWAKLNSFPNTVIYDGQGHSVTASAPELAGENGKYLFDTIVSNHITEKRFDVEVKKPDNTTEKFSATLNEENNTLEFGESYTDVGVYEYTITAAYTINGKERTITGTTTLTILPRPVVVQVKSATYRYDGKAKTVESNGTAYTVAGTGAYFTNGALTDDVKAALEEALGQDYQTYIGSYDLAHVGLASGDSLYGTAAVVYGEDRASSKTKVGKYDAVIKDLDELKDAATATGNYVFIARKGLLTISSNDGAPKTGDNANLSLYASMFIASGCVLAGLLFTWRKGRRRSGADTQN